MEPGRQLAVTLDRPGGTRDRPRRHVRQRSFDERLVGWGGPALAGPGAALPGAVGIVARGTANHPAGRPGLVIKYRSGKWTMAHEIGHVLGLTHPVCGGPSYQPWLNSLMWEFDRNVELPEIFQDQKTIMYACPYTVFM
ncbi:hypothetical protein Daura_13425 [Dactylosporangium aurantiacum]|uniref:Uncharacterized protein n=1 Tax=Dactylosporangium aurantiacum TaxID=35754 RepID=A0A9Q9MLM4_9ACTN|nr:hypothetical protein [Dactylosporangium aurantiacum]MDG6105588.1 hypothetical protein [Dactylosporangium aurantiacum]UWZ57071.1 hypothetical protein Daura_13425 [Dactylosporangium aurantiacum]